MVDCLIKATCAFSHSSGSSNPSLLFSAAHVAINGNGLLAFRAAASAPWRTFVKTSFEGMSSVHVPFFSASSFTASSHSRSTSPSACVFSYILPVCCACPAHATKLSHDALHMALLQPKCCMSCIQAEKSSMVSMTKTERGPLPLRPWGPYVAFQPVLGDCFKGKPESGPAQRCTVVPQRGGVSSSQHLLPAMKVSLQQPLTIR